MQGKYKIDFELFNSINPRTMSKFLKKDQITSSWYEIDAKNAVVGRLATIISKIIRGKNKTTYTPHMDDGDFVVVKNIEQIKFTGKKFQNKNTINILVTLVELKKLLQKNYMKKNLKKHLSLQLKECYLEVF